MARIASLLLLLPPLLALAVAVEPPLSDGACAQGSTTVPQREVQHSTANAGAEHLLVQLKLAQLEKAAPRETDVGARNAAMEGASEDSSATEGASEDSSAAEGASGRASSAGLLETSALNATEIMEAMRRTQAMIASLEEKVSQMTACCNCSGSGGGGEGGGGGKGFLTRTTTTLTGPVSAGGRPTTTSMPGNKKPPATTTTTTSLTGRKPPVDVGMCAAFGDPHFITFDGGHTIYVGERTIWLVKTESVWIQALSKGSDGKLQGVAVGGEFMKGHLLLIYNDTSVGALHVLFDGRHVMNRTEDSFTEPEVLEAYKDIRWDNAIHNDEILKMRTEAKFAVGDWHERFLGEPQGGLFLFQLPDGLEMTVTGVDFMSVVITMPRPAEGAPSQGGYCGNYNGVPEDDYKPVVPSWNIPLGTELGPVKRSENLFGGKSAPPFLLDLASSVAETPEAGRDPEAEGRGLRELLDTVSRCSQSLKTQAVERCSSIEDARLQRDCIFDVCLTKDVRAAEETLATEVLREAVNAKGIPVFMGHGECLDMRGGTYTSIGTKLRTERECQVMLRGLAFVRGVLGTQLHRGSSCQILVDAGLDPTALVIPGGWSSGSAGEAAPFAWGAGQGIIRSTSADASWSCWQLN